MTKRVSATEVAVVHWAHTVTVGKTAYVLEGGVYSHHHGMNKLILVLVVCTSNEGHSWSTVYGRYCLIHLRNSNLNMINDIN